MKLKLSFLLLLSNLVYASDFSGNFKLYGIDNNIIGNNEDRKNLQFSSKLQYNKEIITNLKFEIAYELLFDYGKPIAHSEPEPSYRVSDFNIYLKNYKAQNNYKTLISQNLNRFNLNSSFEHFDISIGRMPIAFGSAKSINPTDVLSPFSIATIDKEEKTGLDAVVIKAPINNLSLIESGFIAGKDFDSKKNAYYIRPKINFMEFDTAFTLMHFKESTLIGFDLQHSIKDAGFWFESSYIDQNLTNRKDFIRLTTGIDYKFQNTLYLAGEYHYNGAALNNLLVSNPYDYIYLKQKHYFILSSNYEFTPLIVGNLQSYISLHDQSSLTALKIDYNIIENTYLSLGHYRSLGDDYKTEFGRYGQVYYLACRYYY